MKGNEITGELVYLPIDELYPHPDNPRKELGDLTELAESIKIKGVMQNLTVVKGHYISHDEWVDLSREYEKNPTEELRQKVNSRKSEDGYTIIIGHRRHAGSKLVGLEKLPCIITEMSPQEQYHTMLMENMQRVDLTPMEQAHGFQIMFDDWGYDEKKISETTGFSETTVRHRLNMAKLNTKAVETYEKVNGFQLSLSDFYALEKVPTVKERNEILNSANSSRDIQNRAAQAETKARRDKASQKIIKLLKKAHSDIEPFPEKASRWDGTWENLKSISLDEDVPDKLIIDKAKNDDMLYYYRYFSEIEIYRKKPKQEKVETAYDKERKECAKRKKQLDAILKKMAVRRRDFVLAVLEGKVDAIDKKDVEAVKDKIWDVLLLNDTFISDNKIIECIIGKSSYDVSPEERDAAEKKAYNLSVLHQMLAVMCSELKNVNIIEWDGNYSKTNAEKLKLGYAVLELYGWTFEEDEERVLDGTHELYTKKKE